MMRNWIFAILILSLLFLSIDARKSKGKPKLEEEELEEEEKTTVTAADHYYSEKEKSTTIDVNDLVKDKPLMLLIDPSNSQEEDNATI